MYFHITKNIQEMNSNGCPAGFNQDWALPSNFLNIGTNNFLAHNFN